MIALVVVLVVTNLATLGALGWLLRQWLVRATEEAQAAPDVEVTALLTTEVDPAGSGGRRLISIEILNPIELAGTRSRLAGLAGAVAPGLTRRLVYDQVVKNLRRQLAEQQVVADVRLHALPPPAGRPATASDALLPDVEAEPGAQVDAPLDAE